jgi:hypothetical protein
MFNGFPEYAEPPETLAEAALALCELTDPLLTGQVLTTGALLADLGRSVCALDGGTFSDPFAVLDLRDQEPAQPGEPSTVATRVEGGSTVT